MQKSIYALIFIVSQLASAGTIEVVNVANWLCKHHADVRTIRVAKQTGACSTLYAKGGVEKSVGGGQFTESCLNFLNNIKTNLEKSGWTCRDITASRFTLGD